MSFLTIASCLFIFVYDCSAVDIMPLNMRELKKNILPKTKDLKLATFGFDFECSYANHTSTSNTDYASLMNYCMKIAPYARLYQRQIQYYNKTAYDTLANDIGKILPKFPTDKRQKRGAILNYLRKCCF